MSTGVLRNPFCEFPWPRGLRWKFECTSYGDSKTLVLSPRGKVLYGMVQAWDLAGNDLRVIHTLQWQRLAAAPAGFPSGVSVERIEVNGQFPSWMGVCNREPKDSPTFIDYELMSRQADTILYYRRSTNDLNALDIRRELAMVKLSPPSLWLAGAELQWVPTTESA